MEQEFLKKTWRLSDKFQKISQKIQNSLRTN